MGASALCLATFMPVGMVVQLQGGCRAISLSMGMAKSTADSRKVKEELRHMWIQAGLHEQGPQHPWHGGETQPRVSEGQHREDMMQGWWRLRSAFQVYRITQFPMLVVIQTNSGGNLG